MRTTTPPQTLPFALLVSVALHLLLMVVLGVVQLSEPPERDEAFTAFLIPMAETSVRPRVQPVRLRVAQWPRPDTRDARPLRDGFAPRPSARFGAALRRISLPRAELESLSPAVARDDVPALDGLARLSLGERVFLDGGSNGHTDIENATQRRPERKATEASGLRMATTLGGNAHANGLSDVPPLTLNSPLEMIAENLIAHPPKTNRVDVVFVLDASKSMQDNIYAVGKHLEKMAEKLASSGLDYRIGIVTFRHTTLSGALGSDLKVTTPTRDIEAVRKTLEQVRCSGDERALNAIADAIRRISFREGAARHFVLVTDEYVDGTYSTREVFGALERAQIRVDVIGMDEPFQRALATRTGGIWMPISSLAG